MRIVDVDGRLVEVHIRRSKRVRGHRIYYRQGMPPELAGGVLHVALAALTVAQHHDRPAPLVALVLEELEHAKARGAKVYAELSGYGMSSDASHMTEPDPTGESPARAMTMALGDAGVDPTEVGYVNAHATSTPLGDSAETRVIKHAFGEEHAKTKLAVSSTKGATGHCFGAAGAVEAVFTVKAVTDRVAPPTINYDVPDPTCDLDYVPNEPRPLPDLRVGLSNSFGFGGHNATIVVRRWDD
jgi:3-oxoacyl-[acyl-carrier-protein] synthase II